MKCTLVGRKEEWRGRDAKREREREPSGRRDIGGHPDLLH